MLKLSGRVIQFQQCQLSDGKATWTERRGAEFTRTRNQSVWRRTCFLFELFRSTRNHDQRFLQMFSSSRCRTKCCFAQRAEVKETNQWGSNALICGSETAAGRVSVDSCQSGCTEDWHSYISSLLTGLPFTYDLDFNVFNPENLLFTQHCDAERISRLMKYRGGLYFR